MRVRVATAVVGLVVVLALAVAVGGLGSTGTPPAGGAPQVVGQAPPDERPAAPAGLSPEQGELRAALVPEPPQAPGTVALVVTDASTGRPLLSGTVLRRAEDSEDDPSSARASGRTPPRAFSRVVVRDAAFPAVLSTRDDDPVVWIGARGYAWTAARVPTTATTLHVALEPAGSLTLRFAAELAPPRDDESWEDRPYLQVELRHEGHQLVSPTERGVAFAADPGDVRHLEAVPVGTYELVALVDSPVGVGQVLARQAFAVSQGEHASVLITPTAHWKPTTLTLRLQVDATEPAREELLRQAVRLFRQDEGGTWEVAGFDAGPLWTEVAPGEVWEASYTQLDGGTYQVFLDPCALAQEVTLVPGTASTVLFDLTDMATVTLEVEACTTDGQEAGLIWGYQANHRRLRKYVRLAPGRSVVQIECAAQPLWVQVVGAGLGSRPVALHPPPGGELAITIGCRSDLTASARIAIIPGARSPTPSSNEFWHHVRFRHLTGDGIMHAMLPWPADQAAEQYEPGTFVGTLLFDQPGAYEMEFAPPWGQVTQAHIVAGAEPAPITVLRLE